MQELLNNLKLRKPFQVIYDGEDFGLYTYNESSKRYEGIIGNIPLEKMVEIIKDSNHFIKLKIKQEEI